MANDGSPSTAWKARSPSISAELIQAATPADPDGSGDLRHVFTFAEDAIALSPEAPGPLTPYASTWGRESLISRMRRESRHTAAGDQGGATELPVFTPALTTPASEDRGTPLKDGGPTSLFTKTGTMPVLRSPRRTPTSDTPADPLRTTLPTSPVRPPVPPTDSSPSEPDQPGAGRTRQSPLLTPAKKQQRGFTRPEQTNSPQESPKLGLPPRPRRTSDSSLTATPKRKEPPHLNLSGDSEVVPKPAAVRSPVCKRPSDTISSSDSQADQRPFLTVGRGDWTQQSPRESSPAASRDESPRLSAVGFRSPLAARKVSFGGIQLYPSEMSTQRRDSTDTSGPKKSPQRPRPRPDSPPRSSMTSLSARDEWSFFASSDPLSESAASTRPPPPPCTPTTGDMMALPCALTSDALAISASTVTVSKSGSWVVSEAVTHAVTLCGAAAVVCADLFLLSAALEPLRLSAVTLECLWRIPSAPLRRSVIAEYLPEAGGVGAPRDAVVRDLEQLQDDLPAMCRAAAAAGLHVWGAQGAKGLLQAAQAQARSGVGSAASTPVSMAVRSSPVQASTPPPHRPAPPSAPPGRQPRQRTSDRRARGAVVDNQRNKAVPRGGAKHPGFAQRLRIELALRHSAAAWDSKVAGAGDPCC
eukprot:TRINITY_DN16403_c0_g1_i1.p1 TRINITY_DN16403_c0_g1~~TRINITY_DN16403_c0_g1_i1.p1  ORF type:complete len:643 (+),score=95.85 TRINITY_DN16403_c0_g1_i1:64-1992(+)